MPLTKFDRHWPNRCDEEVKNVKVYGSTDGQTYGRKNDQKYSLKFLQLRWV